MRASLLALFALTAAAACGGAPATAARETTPPGDDPSADAPFEAARTFEIVTSVVPGPEGPHSAHHTQYDQNGRLLVDADGRARLELVQTPAHTSVRCPPGNTTGIIENTRQACTDDPHEPAELPRSYVLEGRMIETETGFALALSYEREGARVSTNVTCERESDPETEAEYDCAVDDAWPDPISIWHPTTTLRFAAPNVGVESE